MQPVGAAIYNDSVIPLPARQDYHRRGADKGQCAYAPVYVKFSL